jgi:hypothetical protein
LARRSLSAFSSERRSARALAMKSSISSARRLYGCEAPEIASQTLITRPGLARRRHRGCEMPRIFLRKRSRIPRLGSVVARPRKGHRNRLGTP